MKLDLHVHSRYSDGLDTPEQLCVQARKRGLTALALTDHDTLDGLDELFESAKDLIPIGGVELSCGARGDLHILGYGVSKASETLVQALKAARSLRRQRGLKIIERLTQLGHPLPTSLVPSGDTPFGRPHIARALIAKGAVSTMKQAFELYLGEGKPAYVPYEHMTAQSAVRLIREVGGVPVLAHPYRSHLEGQALRLMLETLRENGLMGLEVYHSSVSRKQARELDAMARGMGLLVTGGSDDHQQPNSTVKLGQTATGWAQLESDFAALMQALQA